MAISVLRSSRLLCDLTRILFWSRILIAWVSEAYVFLLVEDVLAAVDLAVGASADALDVLVLVDAHGAFGVVGAGCLAVAHRALHFGEVRPQQRAVRGPAEGGVGPVSADGPGAGQQLGLPARRPRGFGDFAVCLRVWRRRELFLQVGLRGVRDEFEALAVESVGDGLVLLLRLRSGRLA